MEGGTYWQVPVSRPNYLDNEIFGFHLLWGMTWHGTAVDFLFSDHSLTGIIPDYVIYVDLHEEIISIIYRK